MATAPRSSNTAPRPTLQDTVRQQQVVARQLQNQAYRAQLTNAMRAQRAQLVSDGVMDGALPPIHDNMSAVDMAKAQTRMDGIVKARANVAATKVTPAANSAAVSTAAQGAQVAGNAAAAAAGVPPGARPLSPPAVPLAGGSQTPLEKAMATVPGSNGMTVDARQTGAGMVTTVPSASGPREVAVTPTFEQSMHARTNGAWAGMNPQQRAQWLRSNPAPSTGEVTDTGAGAFNERGDRVLGQATNQTGPGIARTPGGQNRTTDAIEYDPRMDQLGGEAIAKKYGGDAAPHGVRFVHPADATPDPGQTAAVNGISPASAHNDINTGTATAANPLAATLTPPAGAPPTGTAPAVTAAPAAAPETAGPPAPAPAPGSPDFTGPLTGAEQLQAAQAAQVSSQAAVDKTNAADAAAKQDADAAQKAQQIQAQPPPTTHKEMEENPNYQNTGPMFGANTTPSTPLGSTSMKDDPTQAFAQKPEDAEFQKKLTFTGFNDGV